VAIMAEAVGHYVLKEEGRRKEEGGRKKNP
jgi:hypothetical protein